MDVTRLAETQVSFEPGFVTLQVRWKVTRHELLDFDVLLLDKLTLVSELHLR